MDITNSDAVSCNKQVKVLIVDDQPLVCVGLRKMLESRPEFKVCGEALSAEEAMAVLQTGPPDLMMVDIMLKDTSGLDLVEHVHAHFPKIVLMVVSIHDEALYAERALQVGALGYVHKLDPPGEVIKAALAVLRGEVYVTEKIASNLMTKIAGRRNQSSSVMDVLTCRELQVFELTGEGLGPTQIGSRLKINKNTVETYRTRIKKKLRFRNAAEMRREAISWTHGPKS
jgi:DNA-binding NarL/FixJ family response regulator